MQDQQAALNQLVESHQARLYGFMRCRVRNDATAQDLAQDTWTEVWQRIDTFDPALGSFWTFTKIWADIVLRRHWEQSKKQPLDPLGDDASGDHAGDDHDAEIGDDTIRSGRACAPEEALHVSQALLEVLCRVATAARPPHEIVVFGFSKLDWKPSEIVAELSDAPLRQLATQLEQDYTTVAPLPTLHVAFCPLRHKLTYRLTEVVPDPRTRRVYAKVLERITGETTLKEYYPADQPAEAAVTRWWDTVKRAVFTDIRATGRGQLFEWLHGRMG